VTLQWHYSDTTVTLQWHYIDTTVTLHWHYSDTTVILAMFSFCNFNLFPLSLTWCIALLMMGAKLQKDGVMQSLGVRYVYLINHKINEKGPKNTVKDAALQRSLLQRGVQPLSIYWLFRKKGQRAKFFGGKKFVFRECPPRWGDTNLLLCNCWFLWCFRNCVFESYSHENIFRKETPTCVQST